MPDLNRRFSSGRMNKDLDERLVPNGEYRDALNIEVTTSEGSDMGTVQTLKGNVNTSENIQALLDPQDLQKFYCVGSIVDEKNDKIYWLISGISKDIIAEYDYTTKTTVPVIIDNFVSGTLPGNDSSRVLNFDRSLLITGINIIEDLLFWTDNYTEPKRIHIERCKMGSVNFTTQTQFYVRDAANINPENKFIPIGPIKHEHITVIKKGPPAAPVLEMRNTLRSETEENTTLGGFIPENFLKIYGNFDAGSTGTPNPFFDSDGYLIGHNPDPNIAPGSLVTIDFSPFISLFSTNNSYPDFHEGDFVRIYPGTDGPEGDNYLRAIIVNGVDHTIAWNGSCEIKMLGGTYLNADDGQWYIELEQGETLFKFKFPRFATRYKYEDGEYSAFSPFSEVAFLPTEFDYEHKEGYNLGMVNNLRFLAIKDFVHGRQIPDDVISLDILYKESNSTNVYTVKTIKRLKNDWKDGWAPHQQPNPEDAIQKYSEWNAIGPNQGYGNNSGVNNIASNQKTRGWARITSEMIHSVLPSNQLLRPWDNVPRTALAQEVTGNRIVYANYLQNFNLYNTQSTIASALKNFNSYNYGELAAKKDIDIDLGVSVESNKLIDTAILPEEKNALLTRSYNPAKSIKTLRTYQLGVIYIDEFGRETPVFSDGKKGGASVYLEKDIANKSNKLTGQIFNIVPEWAKYFKFFIKETSGEYYNLAMDRWYNAEDGNIWLSFASSERNKVDLETFIILKKAHDSDRAIYEDPAQDNYQGFVKNKARYKIISISNEAPIFVKTFKTNKPTFDDASGGFIATASGVGFPKEGVNNFYIDTNQADSSGWGALLGLAEGAERADVSKFEFRFKSGDKVSAWYKIKSVSLINIAQGFYNIIATKLFKSDVHCLAMDGEYVNYAGGAEIELVENIIENRPEFDGRFFVKIKKDLNIIENIIQESSQSKTLVTSQSLQSQYINPQSKNSSGLFQARTETWYSVPASTSTLIGNITNTHEISISEENDSSWWSAGDEGVGEAYWDKAARSEAASTEVNADSNGWFIDKVEGFRPFKYTKYFFDIDDQYGVSDRHHMSGGSKAHKFFNALGGGHMQHQYLDDYEDRGGLQVLGTNTFASDHNDYLFQSTMSSDKVFRPQLYTDGSVIGENLDPDKDIISELRNAPGKQNGKIVPSVGIDVNDNVIHLSYAGIGDEGTPQDVPETLAELKLDFSDFSSYNQYVGDQLFINTICTPGTIWKWAEDPDEILYVTKVPKYDEIDQNSTEWGYNVRDTINSSNYYGVALYNYIIFQDYLISHKHTGNTNHDDYSHWAWASQGFKDHDVDDFDFPTEDPSGSGNWVLQQDNATGVSATNSGVGAALNQWTPWELDYGYSQAATGVENGGTNDFRFGRTAGEWTWFDGAPSIGGSVSFRTTENAHYYHPQRVKEFWQGIAKRRRYQFHAMTYETGGTSSQQGLGIKGVSKYLPTNPTDYPAHFTQASATAATTTMSEADRITLGTPAPGIRSDGMYSGSFEDPTDTNTKIPFRKTTFTETSGVTHNGAPGTCTWEILEPYSEYSELNWSSSNPAIWETEPKESVDLDIYHEVGQIYPVELNDQTNEQFIGPVHPRTFEYYNSHVSCITSTGGAVGLSVDGGGIVGAFTGANDIRVRKIEDNVVYLCNVLGVDLTLSAPSPIFPSPDDILIFTRANGSSTQTSVISVDQATGAITLARDLHNYQVTLPWFNCYSFGNGVESDRIRDDFNQVTIDNGPKASATLDEPYKEERRGSGFIWSGIYNSRSGVNNLNQFIQAEKITKDLNPIYGTIQKLFSRNTNLLAFCEDKVFKVLANKDALFNADGNANITATNRVLGATTPFSGDFGISKNPESFATESFRNYFTDKVRGAVIRLSQDGMTPISDFGMQDYFSDNLKNANRLIGTFDEKKQEYNLTLDHKDYPKPMPPVVMGTGIVQIEGEIGMAPPNPYINVSVYEPTNRLIAPTNIPVIPGQIVEGPGLKPGTVVTNTYIQYGVLYIEISPVPELSDVSPLLGPSDPQYYNEWYTPITILQPSSYSSIFENSTDSLDKTISFSERSKGWVSFKSFILESGVSLNNTYYTFKRGNLWEHHANETRNNFYYDQYDSSVELLFNEAPGTVKSFQTLNYSGTQSRVTLDPGDGEYWDNNIKFGWYVNEMYTNLQESNIHEFKYKEKKWFSGIRGVATEWLDDGKAGNIDTREFSYQGIDNNYSKAIINGGYTSWDCDGTNCIEIQGTSGAYLTEALCNADINNSCGVTGTSWACDARLGCHEVTGLSGGYSSWCDCIQNSSCCVQYGNSVAGLNGIGIVSNSATQYYIDNCNASAIYGCMDDGITTDAEIINNRPFTWTGQASNHNPLANVHTCDCQYNIAPESYDCMPDGLGGFSCQDPGTGLGYYSDINSCLNDPNGNCQPAIPCDPTMPYQFTISMTDATSNSQTGCTPSNADGQIILGVDNLGSLASWIYIEIFENDGSGGLGNQVAGNQSTQYAVNDIFTYSNLSARSYIARFEDDNGCVYQQSFILECDTYQPPVCDTNNFSNTTNVTQLLSGTRCDLISSITQLGEATITVPTNGYGTTTGNFTVSVQSLSQPTSPTYFDITNLLTFNGATMQSPLQTFSFGSSVIIAGIMPSTAAASNYSLFTNGYQFQITITDNNGCHINEIIEISCSQPQVAVTYNCSSVGCQDPGDGSGYYTGPNALANCTGDFANGVSPCPPLSQPCPQNDYISDTSFQGAAGGAFGYTPQLLHAWGGNYRCNNAIFPASCATSYANEFFGDSYSYTSPFQPLTPGSYNINPLAGTGSTPNGGPWSPALIYNAASPSAWSWFSSDKGSLPNTQGGPTNYSQTPLAIPPTIDNNGHLRLSGFKDDSAKSTYATSYPVTQGIYMEVLNLQPNTQYQCVITFGTDWNNGSQAWPNYNASNGTPIIPGSADVGWNNAGELWIGADLTASGKFVADNGSTYAALELDNTHGLVTFPSVMPNYGGIITTSNINQSNFNQMTPGGIVGFEFTKNNNAATGDKDLLVISLVSYDVQHLSIASVCIFPVGLA